MDTFRLENELIMVSPEFHKTPLAKLVITIVIAVDGKSWTVEIAKQEK